MYIANSENKQDLIKHLQATMLMSMCCAKKIGVDDEEIIEISGIAGFLHDIGKCTNYFQNITLKNNNSEKDILKIYPNYNGSNYPRHNEIAWLYAVRHLKINFKKLGTQAIYWHHGTFINNIFDNDNERTTNTIIRELNSFKEDEFGNVEFRIKEIIDSFKFPFDILKYLNNDINDNSEKVSRLFEDDTNGEDISNAKRLIIRSCVIFADHLVSKLTNEELDDLIKNVEKYYSNDDLNKVVNFVCPNDYDRLRFDIQKNIINDCKRTTVIKAPAGFGKSLIGLMWGASQNGQIYWVCPRNSVAKGVFENLIKEINEFKLNLSIELFLTSERKDSRNAHNIKEGCCDIVVTNIDNLLSPFVNQKATNRLFDIMTTNVVFDEFHEFVNDEALFGAFIIYMKARNLLATNCKTLLLSATPSILNKFWDGQGKETRILPNEIEHYKAQHDKKYKIKISDEFIISPNNGTLTMYSSVKNVQEKYENGYDYIAHSSFSENDELNKLNDIFYHFDKNGDRIGKVISAPILQAALDISFTGLYKTIESPESDIQTIGRVNRWGEQDKVCDINFLNLMSNNSERAAINIRYDNSISKLWKEEISKINCEIDLNELYKIYNSFNIANNSKLIKFINEKYNESVLKLKTFFPRQYKNITKTDKVISSKTLRNINGGYFIVVKYSDTNDWCDFVFNISQTDLDRIKELDRDSIESSTIDTVICNLEKIGFDYNDLRNKFFKKKNKKNKLTIEKLQRFARCADSPIPVFSWKYDKKIGLVKRDEE